MFCSFEGSLRGAPIAYLSFGDKGSDWRDSGVTIAPPTELHARGCRTARHRIAGETRD